MPGSKPQD
ncbi:hypothetical protein YPPY11_4948, partial [Yersinia pestis PY-11]